MCGVIGALNFRNSRFHITESYIEQMRDTMIHRGPDGAGTWISPDGLIGLGHRRLSILDLTAAAGQPMANDDKTIWISFNGEIYNHAEIRKEIESLCQFNWQTDHSDTEVIIRAYEVWGIDCIHKFRGMFAFALWDAKLETLWLVRDRIGIKPLYYSVHDNRIVFGSEIKALLEDPDQKRELNKEAFYHYLSFLTTPAPMTLFKGIQKLPGGHLAKVTPDGKVDVKRYWDVWDHTKPLTNLSEDEISQALLAELRTAVKYRKVADVPIGIFLSGGIDSSTNAILFAEGETNRIKTFSIGYDAEYGSYKNELVFAKQVADSIGAEYFERRLTEGDLIEFLPNMIHLQDEPIADPVCVPVFYVSKLARDNGVVVCQVGEGSDELFWGYESWKYYLRLQQMNDWPVPAALKKLGLKAIESIGKSDRAEYELLRRGAAGVPVFWGGAEAFSEFEKRRLLAAPLMKEFKDLTSWEALAPIHKNFMDKAWEKSHLNWMSYCDLNYRLPELLLMRVDKMSMGVSLEGRVPFLDHKFVELAMSIPEAVKTKNGESKHILKKAVTGLMPENIIHRKKQGFGVPVYEWCMQRLGEKMRADIRRICADSELFDMDEVESLLGSNRGSKIWYLYNFALWWDKHVRS